MREIKVLKELGDFISIESVSTDYKRFPQILKAVSFLSQKLKALGFKVKVLKKGNVPPLILAQRIISKNKKTIGIYGHYDVQPEDPIDEWKTAPFKLTVKNKKLYGRGIADNKGSIIQNLTAIENLIKDKKLNNNIVFILEGEEEVGSINLESFVIKAKDVLSKIDVFYITDVGMHDKNMPQIFYGLRGLIFFELEIITGKRDLHSGVYGNRVLNPACVLSSLIAKIKDAKTGRILIPYFYKEVRKPSNKELVLLSKIKRSDKEEKKEAGVFKVVGIGKKRPFLSSKIYPSFDVSGMVSGYIGKGSKTIIPAKALAKFSFRLVEYQDPDKIEKLVTLFVKNNLPKGIKYNLKVFGKAAPFYTDIKNKYVKKTALVLTKEFGSKTLFNRSGGTIPASEILSRLFKKPIILTGFTLPDDNIHSPNENFDKEMFFKGIKTFKKIYRNF